jgi:hypothetical protein
VDEAHHTPFIVPFFVHKEEAIRQQYSAVIVPLKVDHHHHLILSLLSCLALVTAFSSHL